MFAFILLLALLSKFLRQDDPAWLSFNPSPWVVIPMLIGFRYGFSNGMIAAVLSTGTALYLSTPVDQMLAVLQKNIYHFACFPAAVCLAAMARYLLVDEKSELERKADRLESLLQRKDTSLDLYREKQLMLSQSILLHKAEFSSLNDELVSLFSEGKDGIRSVQVNKLISDHFGVLSGGFYGPNEKSGVYELISSSQESEHPNTLNLTDSLVAKAIEEKKTITRRSLWEEPQQEVLLDSPYLAVLPFANGSLFVVRRMKLSSITWENFAKLEAVLAWIVDRFHDHGISDKFGNAVEMAIELRDELGVTSQVVQFESVDQEVTKKVIELSTPPLCIGKTGRDLSVIVPENKENGAIDFANHVVSSFNGRKILYTIRSLDEVRKTISAA